MRRSETDSHIGSRLGHSRQQGCEIHIAESVGVDILSQQSDLPEATAAEVFDLGENASRLARTLAAAGIRDNTVAAKVIAATHYADETADTVSGYAGRNYIAIGLGSTQLDIDRLMARLGSSEQSGQIEIGIGARHEIDPMLRDKFFADALSHAADHTYYKMSPATATQCIESLKAAENLLLGVVAYRASV